MSNSKMPFAYTIRGSATMCYSCFGGSDSVCSRCYDKRLENLRPRLKESNIREEVKNLRNLYQNNVYHILKFRDEGGKYVRMWDFGDFSLQTQVEDTVRLAKSFPKLSFWAPTKAYGLDFSNLLECKNVTLRVSLHDIDQAPSTRLKYQSVASRNPVAYKKTYGGFICPGSCEKDNCRACWDKRRKLIIYKAR